MYVPFCTILHLIYNLNLGVINIPDWKKKDNRIMVVLGMAGRDSLEKMSAHNSFQITTELITTLPDHLQSAVSYKCYIILLICFELNTKDRATHFSWNVT